MKNARIQHRAVEQHKEESPKKKKKESPLSDLKGSDAESQLYFSRLNGSVSYEGEQTQVCPSLS